MSKVIDGAGQAGSGSTLSPAYAVDTRTGADTEGPTLESISFDGDVLDVSHDLVATIRFSEAVQAEGLIDALDADDASLSGLASSDGGRTWTVTLKLATPDVEPKIGSFGVRLDQVRDLAGNAGSGYDPAVAYAVNTSSSFLFLYDDGQSETDGIVSAESGRFFGGILLGDFPDPETSFELMIGAEQIHNSEIAFHKLGGLLYWYYAGEGSWTEGSHEIVAKAVKADGAVVELSKQVQADATAPLIVESPASGTAPPPFDIADSLVIQFSEAVYFTDAEPVLRASITMGGETYSITVPVYPEYLSGDRKTLTIPADAHRFVSGASIALTLPTTEDVAGNLLMTDSFSFTTTGTVADTAAPVALGASLETHDGIPVNVGDTVVFTIRFNEAVTLFGDTARYVNLNNGAKASMVGASVDWTELTFHYFVAAEDADIDQLGVRDLGTLVNQLKDAAGNILDTAAVDFGSLYHDVRGYLAVDQTAAMLAQPTIAIASDSGDTGDYTTRFNQPSFEGAGAEAGATILIKVGAATVADNVVADDAGNWTWTPSAAIVEGAHTLSVQQRDRAGNVSEVRTVDMRIEAFSAPQLDASSDTGVSASDGITTDNTPTYSGSGAIAGSTIKLFAGDTEVGSTTALDDGSWTITAAALADGTHAIVAREYAGATQTDVSAATSLTVDTAAPTVTASAIDIGNRAYTLSFNETIVFAPGGGVGMLKDNTLQKEFFASGGNWTKPSDTHLSFEMGSANGLFKMQTSTGALQDVAGNVVIIGAPHLEFTMPA